ncbi:multicopper oxidase domain-containing protein [Bradyrhizobium sp. ISRA443]|uniref:multicopper oxidase family protein n=1 Tax=unclassified Bradyrhizobium TaxID=2631580 RepID=UPI00247878A1|nr:MULTISPECIES: multicopper oxidase domain-containing protein [unclassified Bradyrhizobium]WGR92644.1 multicopper oxidase domain-containing protein [Bradyrhizobium sp. ISRA435]WGR97075.1 multicopper oxidase domain-containing protein [Bradyrhizobium sp. ISRA436]WGS03963.1 multicopper oxidase domain-containing protein [Bradyrhizobium sp. ISRA437]WGS10846.1 multicopper oxidase domain-containing protein [Bradyrhizobium sp. ISRA443]
MTAWLSAADLPDAPRTQKDVCARPEPGSAIAEPVELRSRDGILEVDLSVHDERLPDGTSRYCYLTSDGKPSPTLRVKPGDRLVIHFKNDLVDLPAAMPAIDRALAGAPICTAKKEADPCKSGAMTPVSTNLHFHGLTVPPVCHQDDVLKTSIQPDDKPFEYRLRIPDDAPPGLYWYHPHLHGFSKTQVLGGASGALIIEGIERVDPSLTGLPERVLVIRDQDLVNPGAPPSKSEPVMSKSQLDNDGDVANSGTGKPSKDLSVNFVPVPYPNYPPATLSMKPGERQLWRVLNASAITYLNLALLVGRAPQQLGVVGIDGVPLRFQGSPSSAVQRVNHIGLPPGSRAEFIVEGPPAGASALLVTRAVDTGPAGENDPNRALMAITSTTEASEPRATLPIAAEPLPPPDRPWVGDVAPVRVRKLFFSERPENPNDPNSPTQFFLTIDGNTPKPFDPQSDVPDIVVRQGDVEDWIIENRSMELHDFHIHQLHFQLLDWSGIAVNEPFLRDTVNVPYYNGRMLKYPSVRLRMDFRDPSIVGTFVYHCHVLEHEDGGMMGRIKVVPSNTATSTTPSNPQNRGEL